jgi:hypothetical protein
MSQTKTPVGPADLRAEMPDAPSGAGASRKLPVARLVVGSMVSLFAVVFLVGGGWALWKDRVDRDGGFVSIGTSDLRTETYAIVGDTHGDGPGWLWEDLLGDVRVRGTSESTQPLFIGVARTDDVFGYLRGVGYATVDSFEVSDDTTHPGRAPSAPPSRQSFWAASTQGSGERTLRWTPRSGDWSVVIMNADGRRGVAVHGGLSAELPILPWLAFGLLVSGATAGVIGGWALVGALRQEEKG